MLTPADLAAIAARLDAIPRWKISPRDIYTCRRVDAGEDALAIAREEVASGREDFLGWDLEPDLDEAGRGFTPTQAVQLVDMRADLVALLAEVERLRGDCDEMQRAAEWAAAAENANAAELATVKAERDEARAIVNACIGACPVTTVAFAGDVPTYIRACFDAVVAERDEAVATLANNEGQGEPPSRGWHWSIGRAAWVCQPWLLTPPLGGNERVVTRDVNRWIIKGTSGSYTSARAAMRAADRAARGE